MICISHSRIINEEKILSASGTPSSLWQFYFLAHIIIDCSIHSLTNATYIMLLHKSVLFTLAVLCCLPHLGNRSTVVSLASLDQCMTAVCSASSWWWFKWICLCLRAVFICGTCADIFTLKRNFLFPPPPQSLVAVIHSETHFCALLLPKKCITESSTSFFYWVNPQHKIFCPSVKSRRSNMQLFFSRFDHSSSLCQWLQLAQN